jgi:hypothetical protein
VFLLSDRPECCTFFKAAMLVEVIKKLSPLTLTILRVRVLIFNYNTVYFLR